MLRIHCHALAIAFCLTLAGCSNNKSATKESTATAPTAQPKGPTAPLLFTAKNGAALPVPLVAVTIGETETLMIVDTGASHIALTSSLVAKLGIERGESETGQDHAGATMDATKLGRFQMQVAGLELEILDAYEVPAPPPFEPLGIGGFLSPHRLPLSEKYVVLDFVNSQLMAVDELSGFSPIEVEFGPDGRAFSTIEVDGVGPLLAEIDTGGSQTEISRDAVSEKLSAEKTCTSIGASGECIWATEIEGQTVTFAGEPYADVKMGLLESFPAFSGMNVQAILGMDILKASAIAVPLHGDAYQIKR
jgi:hypothetical protein